MPLKIGAYVMLLSNSYSDERDLVFANGDCGWIVDQHPGVIAVKLARNAEVVEVCPIVRDTGTKDKPPGWNGGTGHGEYLPRPHWMPDRKRFVEGQVKYFPMRLAYASSVHKSQGLSLDSCQIDIRDSFFGQPAMLYTSLSRCRTMAGLRIVGQKERFISQCNIDPKVRPWL
jgi:ATP-dependent exoDNAse (exonuclease V) alpha subunit